MNAPEKFILFTVVLVVIAAVSVGILTRHPLSKTKLPKGTKLSFSSSAHSDAWLTSGGASAIADNAGPILTCQNIAPNYTKPTQCKLAVGRTLDDVMNEVLAIAQDQDSDKGWVRLFASLKAHPNISTCERLLSDGNTCYHVNGASAPSDFCSKKRDHAAGDAAAWIEKNVPTEKAKP